MKNLKYIVSLLVLTAFFSCDYEDSEWDLPSNNTPTGNYTYKSNTMYFERNGQADPETPIEGSGFITSKLYLNSADLDMVPELGWTYSIHLSNFTKYTLQDSTEVTAFSINEQEVVLDYYYYRVKGTNNKDLRNNDGSLIGYFDGYIRGDSLVFEFRSNDGFESWSIADIEAVIRN